MKNKTVRLSKEQVIALKAEAKKLSDKSPVPIAWGTLIRLAVDEYLNLHHSKAAAR